MLKLKKRFGKGWGKAGDGRGRWRPAGLMKGIVIWSGKG